jgi:hypothetical protein
MSYKRKLYQELSSLLIAYDNCVKSGNDWADKHEERIEELCKDNLPHGSGIDGEEITLDMGDSQPNRLVFHSSYHYMDENGMYDGWLDFSVIVKPSLAFGMDMRIIGRRHQRSLDSLGLGDYLHEIFSNALETEIECGYKEA